MKKKKALPYVTGIIMASLFGLSFLVSKIGMERLSPMVLLGYRFGIAGIVLLLMKRFGFIKIKFKGKPIKGLLVLAFFYPVLSFLFEMWGLGFVSSSQAGIMVSILPVLSMLLGIVMLKEKPELIQMVFVLCSVLGVFTTIVFAKRSNENSNFYGLMLLLISVIAGAIYTILSRKFSVYFTPVETTFVMICSGAVFFNIVAIVQGIIKGDLIARYKIPFQDAGVMGALLYLGVGASVIAFFCMNYTLSKLPTASATVFMNMTTVISIIAGVVVLKEKLSWYQLVGGFFIIFGVWGTNYIEQRTIKKYRYSIQNNQIKKSKYYKNKNKE